MQLSSLDAKVQDGITTTLITVCLLAFRNQGQFFFSIFHSCCAWDTTGLFKCLCWCSRVCFSYLEKLGHTYGIPFNMYVVLFTLLFHVVIFLFIRTDCSCCCFVSLKPLMSKEFSVAQPMQILLKNWSCAQIKVTYKILSMVYSSMSLSKWFFRPILINHAQQFRYFSPSHFWLVLLLLFFLFLFFISFFLFFFSCIALPFVSTSISYFSCPV